MALLTGDLRNACPLATNSDFLGMHRTLGEVNADNLDFATHNYSPRHAREGDFCEVSYFVDRSDDTGQFSLWRRRNSTIARDPLSGGSREEIATGLLGARFEYYDGVDWYDDWGEVDNTAKAKSSENSAPNLKGLPEAVRITLLFNPDPGSQRSKTNETSAASEPMMTFQTIVRLELADAPAGSAASGDDTTQPNSAAGPQGSVAAPTGGFQ